MPPATVATVAVTDGAGSAGAPSSAPTAASTVAGSAIARAELLPVDRALVSTTELRQTCNAIELLRSAAREGAPVHEWTLRDFSSLGPGKVSSAPFELYGRRWSLLLHPRGCGANAQGTHVSAYLRLEHGPACDARVRLAVRNHHSPALSTFNKPWQWRFESNGKNRGVSSLLPLASANSDSGFVVDDVLVLQLWLRPLGAAESRCLPPGQEDGLPEGDMLQPAARRHFHAKLLLAVWLSTADEVLRLLEQLCPTSTKADPGWATERHRLQLLALNAAAADGRKDALVALLDSGALFPVQLYLRNLPPAFAKYSGPYERVESPAEKRTSFGRPVYRSGACWLFYAEDADGNGETAAASQWIVGREEDLGRTHGWMYADDDATSPDLITAEWQLWEGGVAGGGDSSAGSADAANTWRGCGAVRATPSAPFLEVRHSLTPLHYAAWGGQLECTNISLKLCKPYSPNPVPPRYNRRSTPTAAGTATDGASPPLPVLTEGGNDQEECTDGESPLLLAARGTAGAAPVVQLLAAEGFCDHRALGAAMTHTVRIGLLEAALLRHPEFMALIHDPFAQLAQAVERFPKPLGAALSNLLGWFSCSLYRDGSTVGPFGSLSAPCQEAVLWRVAEAVLMPPGSTGNSTPLHRCALNESCLWEWIAQWDLMMRMSDKLESLLSEGMDDAEGDAAEGVYRNLALRYAAQLEECCQLLYGDDVAAELGIQSDGFSVERWSCGGQFLVDVIGRWVFGPSFWIKEHLWRLPDGPSRWEAYRGYHNQLRGTELLLPTSYMNVDPWLLALSCFRGTSAASGRESSMIRYCLELMQSHARHLEGTEPDESTKSGKSRAEMSLSEAWRAKCPYINALDLKRGKNRPLYSYMSSVITEGIHGEGVMIALPTPAERGAAAAEDADELIEWWSGLTVAHRHKVLAFPIADLERTVWVCSIWEVLLHKLPDLLAGEPSASQRVACVNGNVQLGPALATQPEEAVRAMQAARARELDWAPEPGEGLEAAKQRTVEQLALCMLQQRMVEAHKRDSKMEDAERMAQQLIAEEEESKARIASKAKKNAKKKKKKKGKGKEDDDDDDAEAEEAGDLAELDVDGTSPSHSPPSVPTATTPPPASPPAPPAAPPPAPPEEPLPPAVPKETVAKEAKAEKPEKPPKAAKEKSLPTAPTSPPAAKAAPAPAAPPASKLPSKATAGGGNGRAGDAAATPDDDSAWSTVAPSKSQSAKGAKGRTDAKPAAPPAAPLPAPATAVAAAAAPPSNGSRAPVHIDPSLVERLRDMTGATNQRCKEALRLHNGNADSAALWLLCDAPSPAGASPATALAPGVASASPASPISLSVPVPAGKGGREMPKALDGGKAPTSPISAPLSSPSSGGLPSPPANAAGSTTRMPTVPLTAESPGFDGAEMMGVVRDTPPGKPYGFISVWHHNVTLFYHYNDVLPSAKDSVKRHTAVAFSIASWSQGYKAERVRPLTAAEQKVGVKDGRMALLRATVKKWDAADRSGMLQLIAQPCSLPFQVAPALASRLAVNSTLVCKIDGKGKDLAAVHLQLPALAAPPSSEAATRVATAASRSPGSKVIDDGPLTPTRSAALSAKAAAAAVAATFNASAEVTRAPLSGNREHASMLAPPLGNKGLVAAPSSAWPPGAAPSLGLSVSAASAEAFPESGSSSSSPQTHLSPDRQLGALRPGIAPLPKPVIPVGGGGAPPGLGALAGRLPHTSAPAPSAAVTSRLAPPPNGGAPPQHFANPAGQLLASAPQVTSPQLAWPTLPSALQDFFSQSAAAAGGVPPPTSGPPPMDAQAVAAAVAAQQQQLQLQQQQLQQQQQAAQPAQPAARPNPSPLFPGLGGGGWGMGGNNANAFGALPSAPPPARTHSLPTAAMPPSLFPFNAQGWGGGGGEAWGAAVPPVPSAGPAAAAGAVPAVPPGMGGPPMGMPPGMGGPPMGGVVPGQDAGWSNAPLVEPQRGKSAGSAGGYSLF